MMCFFFSVAGWSLEVKKRTVALQDWKFNRDPRWEAKLLRILPLHQQSGVYFKVFSSTAIFWKDGWEGFGVCCRTAPLVMVPSISITFA